MKPKTQTKLGIDWNNPIAVKEYYREYRKSNINRVRELKRKWQKDNKERKRELDKKYYNKYRKKRLIHYRKVYKNKKRIFKIYNHLNYLERIGKISKNKSCQKCNSEKNLIKHHPDYNKPLFFITLCKDCHNKEHNLIKEKET